MSIKLIASDLDGTIIDENNSIAKSNFDAIETINNKNINFAICTGKPYSVGKNLCNQFNANYGIFGNGSQIIDLKTGNQIYSNKLSKDSIRNCINIAKKNNLHIHAYSNNELISEELRFLDLRNFKLLENKNFKFAITDNILEYVEKNNLDIYQIVISDLYKNKLSKIKTEILQNNDLTITTISKFGKYKDTILDKEYEYLSISPKNTNKDEALKILRNYLNLDNNEIMAIGDNLNDLEMVKNSGLGVAVANAYTEIKDIAKYTTKKNVTQGGFAEAVFKFIK